MTILALEIELSFARFEASFFLSKQVSERLIATIVVFAIRYWARLLLRCKGVQSRIDRPVSTILSGTIAGTSRNESV